MNAQQLYQSGRLEAAIEALNATLRDDPANARQRTFLFELLCFAGQYERAEKQLDIVARSSREAEMGAFVYRSALHAERIRQEMFQADPPAPPAGAEPVAGTLNGRPFRSLTDTDPRIGARLEVFAAGQYTWIPFTHLASVAVEAPRRLRDLLWIPASVKAGPDFSDFDFGEILIPCLTPLAWRHPDEEVRLGRVTDWEAQADGPDLPVGLKMLQMDDELVPLLEIRELVFHHAD